MRILFLPKYYEEGSGSRYRYFNYFPWFRQSGIEITCRPLLYNGYVRDLYHNRNRLKRIFLTAAGILRRLCWLQLHKNEFDLIIIEKELVSFLPFAVEKYFLKGTTFIVDHDDNINARYQTGWSKIFLSTKIPSLARLAAAVTIGNHWYRELFKDIDPARIHYLPTVVDHHAYASTPEVAKNDGNLTIAWIGSPSTGRYLKNIEDVLIRIHASSHVQVKIIGARIPLKIPARYVEWTADTEIAELKQCDIGIMPLANTDWEKGKCGLKLIQYMACGLPVVASYTRANDDIIHNEAGFIARSSDDWFEHLSTLVKSAEKRALMGQQGKDRVALHYSYETWAPVFISLVQNIERKLPTVS